MYPSLNEEANHLLEYYLDQKKRDDKESILAQKTNDDEEDPQDEIPERKVRKKKRFKPRGPVGLLVAAMALNSLNLTCGFGILEPEEPPFKTMGVPWQMLEPMLNEKFVRARQREAEKNRSALEGIQEVDHFILRKTSRKLKGEDEAILKSVVTLATADD